MSIHYMGDVMFWRVTNGLQTTGSMRQLSGKIICDTVECADSIFVKYTSLNKLQEKLSSQLQGILVFG